MKRFATTPNLPPVTPDGATQKAIDLLDAAKNAVDRIVEIRRREKLSSTRAAHVAREIHEIIKVLSLYLPNEK
jgi:hypothetical protein